MLKLWRFLYMEKTLYYNILEILNKKGVGVSFNIKPFIMHYLQHKNTPTERTKGWNEIMPLFSLMKNNDHIRYDESQFGHPEFLSNSEIKFCIQLTYIGAEYFAGIKLTVRTIRNFSWNRWLTLGGLSVSIFSTWYAVHKNHNLETELRLLQKQYQSLPQREKVLQVNIPIKIDTVRLTTENKK